jgi:uncharacterized protein YdhG (YjbR/CyaY superfamily)
MQSRAATVAEYVASLPAERKPVVEAVRELFRKVAPDLVEKMAYGMPVFEVNGVPRFSVASQKNYVSLYLQPEVVEKHRASLGKLSCGRCCIRFRRLDQLPMDVIERICRESLDSPPSAC